MGEHSRWPRLRSSLKIALSVAVAILFVMPGPVGLPTRSVQAQQPLQEYVLKPGDAVEITVFGEADLSRTVTIRPDGKINLPLIGDIQAAGFSPAELGERLTTALRVYIKNPQVSVSVREFQRAFVQVVGQVARPGSVEIQRGWTVLEVMGAAGGVSPRAALRRATLTRRATGEVIVLDLDRLLLKGDQSANVPVEPGDVIMVPTLQNRVLVLGAVARPGAYDIEEGARIFEVISQAGGPVERSVTNNIGIIRVGRDGKAVVTTVDLTKFVAGDLKQNVPMQNEDIIYLPPDNSVRWTDILGYLGGLNLIRTLLGHP